jgi:hypothetical protein
MNKAVVVRTTLAPNCLISFLKFKIEDFSEDLSGEVFTEFRLLISINEKHKNVRKL